MEHFAGLDVSVKETSGHEAMSLFWSLSGVKRTWHGAAKIDANDPKMG